MTKAKSTNTLFVRNLSKDTTKEELTQAFSDVGPVKYAMVIHERHGGPSKGFGFVTFALPADAEEALKKPFVLKGKTLKLDWASEDKKIGGVVQNESSPKVESERKVKQKTTTKEVAEVEEAHEAEAEDDEEDTNEKQTGESASTKDKAIDWKKMKDERRRMHALDDALRQRTVVLFNLPEDFSEQQLRKRLKKRAGGAIETIERDQTTGLVRVVYVDATKVPAAVKEISGREWGGVIVTARRGTQVFDGPAGKTKCRLICRNLGFHVTEKLLKDAFGEHGPLCEVTIQKDANGRSKGFAFVQFFCRHDAQKAIETLNATTELGPKKTKAPIAVDFALGKDRYEAIKQREQMNPQAEASPPEPVEEEEGESDSASAKKVIEFNEEEEAEEKENEDEGEEDESNASESNASESDDSNEEDEDEDNEEEEEEGADDTEKTTTTQVGSADKGVHEGRTLFVSNLLFETDDDTIRKRFGEFGPVRGVKLVKDQSGRSRGLGFVEFWSRESCDKALATNEITLEGRVIFIKRAVDKDTASKLKKDSSDMAVEDNSSKGKKKFDKRHLYLAGEGRLAPEKVPNADRKKRQALEDEKRTKLKNPLFFVSPTRLSIKNLNRKPNETLEMKDLKKLFKEAAIRGMREKVVKDNEGDRSLFPGPGEKLGAVRVTKATVFHESIDDPNARSSGFAFVEMSSHAHALAALRMLNNNPEYAWAAAGGKQAMKLSEENRPRLIVSFAIENAAKLKAQQARLEKSKKSNPKPAAVGSNNEDAQNKKPESDGDKKREGNKKGAAAPQPKKMKRANGEDESENPPKKKTKTGPKSAAKSPKAGKEGGDGKEERAPAKSKPKKEKMDISNRAFEKKVRKRPNTSDELDEIVSKRSNLFEVPEGTSAGRKRWFEE